MGKQIQNISYLELSRLIITAIEDEQFFRKDILIPKIKALMNGFQFNLNTQIYNEIEKPSESARRKIKLLEREAENLFWKTIVRNIDAENINKHYLDCDTYLTKLGFRKKLNSEQNVQASVATDDDSSTKADNQK